MWENIVEQSMQQITTWCMRIARWMPKAWNTLTEYAILIAFALQHWFHEHNSMLHHTHLACLLSEVKVFLVRATCWWSWVWGIDGMTVTRKHRRTLFCSATLSEMDFVSLHHSCTCWEQERHASNLCVHFRYWFPPLLRYVPVRLFLLRKVLGYGLVGRVGLDSRQ
jgi:hypothetical protein